jgi:hypothetical protein
MDSASGTSGSGRWNWYSAICSSLSRRRLPSQASRRCSGRPSGAHRAGPGRTRPPLVAIVRVRVQRLGDQRLADLRTVGVRGVDEVDVESDRLAQRGLSPLPVRRLPQMPWPVIRMAPKPSRLTVRSPPMPIVPAVVAVGCALMEDPLSNLLLVCGCYQRPAPRTRSTPAACAPACPSGTPRRRLPAQPSRPHRTPPAAP